MLEGKSTPSEVTRKQLDDSEIERPVANAQERQKGDKSENAEQLRLQEVVEEGSEDEITEKVLDWIGKGADVQEQILDLTKATFKKGLDGDEAAEIIEDFSKIPQDIEKVLADFDTTIGSLMTQRGLRKDPILELTLKNAMHLKSTLEEKREIIERESEITNIWERLATMFQDGRQSVEEGYKNWAEGLLGELKKKGEEIKRFQKDTSTDNASKVAELQGEMEDMQRSVVTVIHRSVFNARLENINFRTRNFILLNSYFRALRGGEERALTYAKFKVQDDRLVAFGEQNTTDMTEYEEELRKQLTEIMEPEDVSKLN